MYTDDLKAIIDCVVAVGISAGKMQREIQTVADGLKARADFQKKLARFQNIGADSAQDILTGFDMFTDAGRTAERLVDEIGKMIARSDQLENALISILQWQDGEECL